MQKIENLRPTWCPKIGIFLKKNLSNFVFLAILTLKMTSKFKFDLIRPTQFGGALSSKVFFIPNLQNFCKVPKLCQATKTV